MSEIDVQALQRTSYELGRSRMQELVAARATDSVGDTLLLYEHEPVYTAGRREAGEDIVDSDIDVVPVERGGRITYHGPGQLVAYPIVALTGRGRDLHAWLRLLEDVVIDCLATFGLPAERDSRGTGVFTNGRKIASIGIAVRRWVTFHGLALNVTTDLAAFEAIRPCGFTPDLMTSLANELESPSPPSVEDTADRLASAFVARHGEYPRTS